MTKEQKDVKKGKKMSNPNKAEFTCWHAHDYSTIERNGEEYLEVTNCDQDTEEFEGTVAKVEYIVELLNKAEENDNI